MIVFEIVGTEAHPAYQDLAIANLDRQYDFLRSIVTASLALNRPMLSVEVIRALNYHAISCLHTNAGEFRPCEVFLPSGLALPAPHRVPALMAMFVDEVNRGWSAPTMDPIALAAFILWKLNVIHPFINGNGRTARVACYFVICIAFGGWLPGTILLPQLLLLNRPAYVAALQAADAAVAAGKMDLSALHALLVDLLNQQLASAAPPATPAALPAPTP